MIRYYMNQKLELNSENGIWVDYADHTWVFMIKDTSWQPEEIKNTETKGITVSFIQKGIIDAFLVQIHDCMETSDVPFCLLDATKDLMNSFKDSESYQMILLLIDDSNTVRAIRTGTFNKEFTKGMKRTLQQRKLNMYDERSYSAAYTKLCKKYEPFELEPFALYTQQF